MPVGVAVTDTVFPAKLSTSRELAVIGLFTTACSKSQVTLFTVIATVPVVGSMALVRASSVKKSTPTKLWANSQLMDLTKGVPIGPEILNILAKPASDKGFMS